MSESEIRVQDVAVDEIQASPENDEIYGAVDTKCVDFINLANDIARHGVREPLTVSADGYILSGHRRYAAAKAVGLSEVPVMALEILRSRYSGEEWKRKLVEHNLQRVKSPVVRIRETVLLTDADDAYQQLCHERDQKKDASLHHLEITGEKKRSGISKGKHEMLNAAIRVIESLKEYWPLSVRQVHYQLLNDPPLRNTARKNKQQYQNDRASYQDLCDLLTRARIAGNVPWEAITDETRPVRNTSFQKDASQFFDVEFYGFLRGYRRDLLQSQLDHVELIVEKLTVQNIVAPIANRYCVPMTVGRGYCSLEPRKEIVDRYRASGKRKLILLIASDFDPDGDEIADSLVRSIRDDFGINDVEASKVLLRSDQVQQWKLPPNDLEAKESSSRFKKFVDKYGSTKVYELEAVPIETMQRAVEESIQFAIDMTAYQGELENERNDAVLLTAMKSQAREFFANSDLSGLSS